jgi:hypothetical protein
VENAASSLHCRLDGDKLDSDVPSAAVIEMAFGEIPSVTVPS